MKATITRSSGNVFADLGVSDAVDHNIKADLVLQIGELIKRRGLRQSEVAQLMNLAQPDVSKLLRGHFSGYSYDRLFGFLTALGQNVTIDVKEARSKKHAKLEMAYSLRGKKSD